MLRASLSLVVVGCSLCAGQQVSPVLSGALKWRSIGPFRGGRAVAVSGVRGGGSTFYFGSVDGGIWRSDDAGVVWTPIFDGQPVASIGALAVAPSDSNIIYAGTGESDIRSDLASGDGVYKSIDGGQTWNCIGLRETRQISRIVVDPRNPKVVLVAALGHAYAPNEERGVFRSSDGGATWTKVLYRGPGVGAADIALADDDPNVVYASLWEAHRPPWSTYAPLGGPGSGLFRSTDGGLTWGQLTGNGLPTGEWGRSGVAIANTGKGQRVYAAIDAKDAGLYRSDDGGNHWTRVNNDPRITSRAWYFSHITVDPHDPDVVYIPNVAVYKLSDGGKTLSIVRGAPGGDDYHQLWIDPANSAHMLLGSDQGTTVSLDGGRTWSSWYNQPTAQFYHVITDNDFPYHVYGAQQDSGTAATASWTRHGEIDSRDWFSVGGSESGYIALDPKDPNLFYITGTFGTVARYDRRTMQSQNIAPSPLLGFSADVTQREYRDPWTPVIVFSPAQPEALYLGTQYVMKTIDGGLHWQTVSPDLTGADATVMAAKPHDAPTVETAKARGFGVVYTIAPSPLRADEIWAGSDTGLIHLTTDGGKSWKNVTPPNLSAWSKITFIEASHSRPGEAYAAVDRHRLDDRKPYLFRTRDFGQHWTLIVAGIGEQAFCNVVREDPKHPGLLFAGTEFGVYASFDDGDHWQSLQLNLPITSVRDLAVHEDDLVVATHGRAFWILDDIEPLRQMTRQWDNDAALLFRPARAFRVTSDVFSGTPLPPEEPQAPNPPRGAYLDYFLKQTANGPVRLEVLNSSGKVVRQFSSSDPLPPMPKDPPIAPRWLVRPKPLSPVAGLHRFIWDLRYGLKEEQTTADLDDVGMESWIGPLALPGSYEVRLTVDGKTFEQPFEVAMDPGATMSSADLQTQFDWAQRDFVDLVTARKAKEEIVGLRSQLDKLPMKNLSQELGAASKQLGELQTNGFDPLDHAFTAALGAIEGADRVPPSQVIALYESSAKTLHSSLEEWNRFQQTTLPHINRQLRSAGLKELSVMRVRQESQASLSQ